MYEERSKLFRKRGIAPPPKAIEVKTVEEAVLRMKPDTGVMLLAQHVKDVKISANIKTLDVIDEDSCQTISLFHNIRNQNPIIEKFISFYRICPQHDTNTKYN